MIQKQFAQALDDLSHAYMRFRKKRRAKIFFEGGMKEFLESADVTNPMKFFANPNIVPEVEIEKNDRRSGYSLNFFRFESFVETPYGLNNKVHGRFYKIHGKLDAPTVIALHGWCMENYRFSHYYYRLLLRSGFNAAIVDLPYHMNRRVPNTFHAEYTFSDNTVLTILVMKQCVLDMEGTINWVKRRGTRLIGMFGVTCGGMLSGIVGCVEPSVDFMMLVSPHVDLLAKVMKRLPHKNAVRSPIVEDRKPLSCAERILVGEIMVSEQICEEKAGQPLNEYTRNSEVLLRIAFAGTRIACLRMRCNDNQT